MSSTRTVKSRLTRKGTERGLVLTDWTHWSWESLQAVIGHTKSYICRCTALCGYHQSSKQQQRQRNHRWQHSHQALGTSLAELLMCHHMLGLCGFLTVVQQLNLAFKTVLWTMHIAGLMNRRTAWTVLLSCPILLPKQLLSQAAMLFALTVLHRSAKFRLVMSALF